MREILFRGKKIDNGQWTYGLPTYDMKYIFSENDFDSPDSYMVDVNTIGQYTGLKDKNGTKIFEGDICVHSTKDNYPRPLAVEWIEDYAFFAFADKGGYNRIYYFQKRHMENIRVVGNIHDNKELLK